MLPKRRRAGAINGQEVSVSYKNERDTRFSSVFEVTTT